MKNDIRHGMSTRPSTPRLHGEIDGATDRWESMIAKFSDTGSEGPGHVPPRSGRTGKPSAPEGSGSTSSPNFLKLGVKGTMALGLSALSLFAGVRAGVPQDVGSAAYEVASGTVSGIEKGTTILWDQLEGDNHGLKEPSLRQIERDVKAQEYRNQIQDAAANGQLPPDTAPTPGPQAGPQAGH